MLAALLIVDQHLLMFLKAITHLNFLTPRRSQCRPPLIQTLLQFFQLIRLDRENLSSASPSRTYMFSIIGLLPDLLCVPSGLFHILFQRGQFLCQGFKFLLAGLYDRGKLVTIFFIFGTGNVAGCDSVIEGRDLFAEIIDFGFLTSEFDTADFHNLFLEGLDFVFDA